jgi:cytochrome b561
LEPIRYHRVAILLHWLIALLIVVNLAMGLTFDSDLVRHLATETRYGLYQWHKTFGIIVLFLSVFRLGWRLTHPAPAMPQTMPRWEKSLAHLGHIGLYVLMIAIPFTGWLLVSASTLNIPTLMFNLFPWPHLPIAEMLEDRGAFAKNMSELHELVAFAMIGLLVLHISAALRHHFLLKDDVLKRMLPNKKSN